MLCSFLFFFSSAARPLARRLLHHHHVVVVAHHPLLLLLHVRDAVKHVPQISNQILCVLHRQVLVHLLVGQLGGAARQRTRADAPCALLLDVRIGCLAPDENLTAVRALVLDRGAIRAHHALGHLAHPRLIAANRTAQTRRQTSGARAAHHVLMDAADHVERKHLGAHGARVVVWRDQLGCAQDAHVRRALLLRPPRHRR